MYLVPKCNTEFGKKNSINLGIILAINLGIDVSLFSDLKCYKNILSKKN